MMEQRQRPPTRNRCSLCRQTGHNRSNCPHTPIEATRLREEFNQEQRRANLEAVRRANARTQESTWQSGIYAQVVDMQQRLAALTTEASTVPPRNSPTIREQKIQEILFENSDKIPEGLYKDLMDALVIRG